MAEKEYATQEGKARILFLSCSAGSGHVRAADALHQSAKALFADKIESEHADIIRFLPKTVSFSMLRLYPWIVNRGKELWRFLYETADNPRLMTLFYKTAGPIIYAQSKGLFEYIEQYHPDVIVCTHSLAAQLLYLHKKRGHPTPPYYIVLTDYELHSYWLINDAAGYFIPNKEVSQSIINFFKGHPPQITETGIPVLPVFSKKQNTAHLTKTLGIMHEKVVLFLSGGEGLVRLDKLVEEFNKEYSSPITIITVAGKNKKLKKKLDNLHTPSQVQHISIGWTSTIHELFAVADIVCTKPGGMTVSECMATGKKLLLFSPIPGQEEGNIRFLSKIKYPYVLHNKKTSLAEDIKKLLLTTAPNPKNTEASKQILSAILKNTPH